MHVIGSLLDLILSLIMMEGIALNAVVKVANFVCDQLEFELLQTRRFWPSKHERVLKLRGWCLLWSERDWLDDAELRVGSLVSLDQTLDSELSVAIWVVSVRIKMEDDKTLRAKNDHYEAWNSHIFSRLQNNQIFAIQHLNISWDVQGQDLHESIKLIRLRWRNKDSL